MDRLYQVIINVKTLILNVGEGGEGSSRNYFQAEINILATFDLQYSQGESNLPPKFHQYLIITISEHILLKQ